MKRRCPANCWCDCHDKKIGITDRIRLNYLIQGKGAVAVKGDWLVEFKNRKEIDSAIRNGLARSKK